MCFWETHVSQHVHIQEFGHPNVARILVEFGHLGTFWTFMRIPKLFTSNFQHVFSETIQVSHLFLGGVPKRFLDQPINGRTIIN